MLYLYLRSKITKFKNFIFLNSMLRSNHFFENLDRVHTIEGILFRIIELRKWTDASTH